MAGGDAAENNPFRFSSKYTDDETKLVCHGTRQLDIDPGIRGAASVELVCGLVRTHFDFGVLR